MRKLLFLLVSSALIFSSCKKSDSGSTVSVDTYLPSTIGTNWTYKVVTPTSNSNVTYTVSSKDTIGNGRTYQVITGSNGTNQYYAKSGNDYYTFRAVNSAGLELNFLKDNLDVNGIWNTSQVLSGLTGLPVSSLTINTLFTIKAKGGTRIVNTVTYNNVIQVRADLTAVVPFIGNLPMGYVDFFFSKNVGVIETNFQIANTTAGININEQYTLLSYQVK